MKQILTLIYVLATAAYSVFAVATELQPALFWISLFAQNIGGTYPLVLVGLLTFLTLLMPLVIILLIKRMLPEKPQVVEGSGIWIIRKRQLQSALVEIPVFINEKKVGGIAMGKIKFFPAPAGTNVIKAGKGLSVCDPVTFTCGPDEQVYYNLEIKQAGLLVKMVLTPVSGADKASL